MTQQAAEQQAQAASARVLAILAAYQAGRLTKPDAEAAMATAVYVGKVLASRLADISISTISNLPPLGITPGTQHVERLEEAVSTVLDEEVSPDLERSFEVGASERLERLAMSETLNSHRKSLHAAIRDHGFPSWVRVVADDPCEICAPLAGEIQPVAVGFKDHPGCRCTLLPHGEPNRDDRNDFREPSDSQTEPARLVTIHRTA